MDWTCGGVREGAQGGVTGGSASWVPGRIGCERKAGRFNQGLLRLM